MSVLVDPLWQEAAAHNASQGAPWAVWGKRKDQDWPLGLLCSKQTKEDAERFAALERSRLRPLGQWSIIVVYEANEWPIYSSGERPYLKTNVTATQFTIDLLQKMPPERETQ